MKVSSDDITTKEEYHPFSRHASIFQVRSFASFFGLREDKLRYNKDVCCWEA